MANAGVIGGEGRVYMAYTSILWSIMKGVDDKTQGMEPGSFSLTYVSTYFPHLPIAVSKLHNILRHN